MNTEEINKIKSLVEFLSSDIALEDEVIVASRDSSSFKFLGIKTFALRRGSDFGYRFGEKVHSSKHKNEASLEDNIISETDKFILNEIVNSWVGFAKKHGVEIEDEEINAVRSGIDTQIDQYLKSKKERHLALDEITRESHSLCQNDEDGEYSYEGREEYIEAHLEGIFPIIDEVKKFTSMMKKRISLNHPFIFNNLAQNYVQVNGVKSHQALNSGVVDFLKKKVERDFSIPEPQVIELNKSLDYDQALIFDDKSIALRDSRKQKYVAFESDKYSEVVKTLCENYVLHVTRKRPKLGQAIVEKLEDEGYKVEGAILLFEDLCKYKQLFKEFNISSDQLVKDNPTYEKVYDFVQDLSYKNEVRKFRKSFMSNKYNHLVNDNTDSLFKELYDMKVPRRVVEDGLIKKIASFRDAESFNSSLKVLVSSLNNFTKEAYLVKSETQNADVIYEGDNQLILRIHDAEASSALGSGSWCIRREYYFNDYVTNRGNAQYFVYNFNCDSKDDNSMLGFTLKSNGDVHAAHDKADTSIDYHDITKEIRYKIIPNDQDFFTNLSERNEIFLEKGNKKRIGLR